MRGWVRLVGLVSLVVFAASPLGVAAEGYVCASGQPMVHNGTAKTAACAHCRPSAAWRAAAQASFERPCCLYVGTTALPPVASAASAPALQQVHTAPLAMPGVTAVASSAHMLTGVPQYESGGSGVPPPPLTLRTAVLLN